MAKVKLITPENQGEGVTPVGGGRQLIVAGSRPAIPKLTPQQIQQARVSQNKPKEPTKFNGVVQPDYTNVSSEDMYNDIYKRFANRADATQQSSAGFNPYEQFSGLDDGISFRGSEDFAKSASEQQSGYQQGVNAVVGGTINGAIKAIEALSYLPNIITRDWEKTAFQEGLSQAQANVNKELPVYSDPNNPLSWDSSMFWSGTKGAIESGLQFALPGFAISKGIGLVGEGLSIASKAIMSSEAILGSRGLAAGIETMGVGTSKGVNALMEGLIQNPTTRTAFLDWASNVPAGVIQNQLEGTIMGMDAYKNKEAELRAAGETNEAYIKQEASAVADDLRFQNMAMIAKDVWEMKAIFGKSKVGAQAITDQSRILPELNDLKFWKAQVWKDAWKSGKNPVMQAFGEMGEEMVQGGIEDNIMNQSRIKENEDHKDNPNFKQFDTDLTGGGGIGDVLRYSFSDQNVFEGLMGFFGGGFQNALGTIPGKVIDNVKYKKLNTELKSVNEAIEAEPDETKKTELRTQAEQLKSQIGNTVRGHYDAQQAIITENNALIKDKFDNLFEAHDLHEKAVFEHDDVTKQIIEDNLFNKAALDNLKKGTLPNFRQTIEDISNNTPQAQAMIGGEITPEMQSKAKSMAGRLTEIETEWNRHSDPQLGARMFLVGENVRTLTKAVSLATDRLDKTKEKINADISVYNRSQRARNPNHNDLANIEELEKPNTVVDELDNTKESKIINDEKKNEFLNNADYLKDKLEVDKFQKELDSATDERSYLNSSQYRKWNDKINTFLSKNANNLTSEKIDKFKEELDKLEKGVKNTTRVFDVGDTENNSKVADGSLKNVRLSQAGKNDLKARLNTIKFKVKQYEAIQKLKDEAKLKAQLQKQKEDEFVNPFMDKAIEGNGYIINKNGNVAHVTNVSGLNEDGEITIMINGIKEKIIPYLQKQLPDGTMDDSFREFFINGTFVESDKATYEAKVYEEKFKASNNIVETPVVTTPEVVTNPIAEEEALNTVTEELFDDETVDTTPISEVPTNLAGDPKTEGEVAGNTSPEDTFENNAGQETVSLAELKQKNTLVNPSGAVSYSSRESISLDNGKVVNASDTRIMKPIDGQSYVVGTPVTLTIQESDLGQPLESVPIRVVFDGDKDFENGSYVPTVASLLSTEGTDNYGFFSEPDPSKSDENNKYLILTNSGREVLAALEQYDATRSSLDKERITQLISAPFIGTGTLRPFTKILAIIKKGDDVIVDYNIVTTQLIQLYQNRKFIIEQNNKSNGKGVQTQVSKVYPGHVSLRVDNAVKNPDGTETPNTNLISTAKFIKDTGVEIRSVSEDNALNVFAIPMKRSSNDSNEFVLVNMKFNKVNKELIHSFIEDYLNEGPITKGLDNSTIIKLVNTAWNYDFDKTNGRNYINFDIEKNGGKRQLTIGQGEDAIFIKASGQANNKVQLLNKDNKLTESQKILINNLIGTDYAPGSTMDVTDNASKNALFFNKGKLTVRSSTNKDIVINNTSTDILYTKQGNDWIFHDQATYELDYNIADDVLIVEDKEIDTVESDTKSTPITTTSTENTTSTTDPDTVNNIDDDDYESIKTYDPNNPNEVNFNQELLSKFTIDYPGMTFAIQQEFVDDMASRIIKRFLGTTDKEGITNIKQNLASVKKFYFEKFIPANKHHKFSSNMADFYDQLEVLALEKVKSFGLTVNDNNTTVAQQVSSNDDSIENTDDLNAQDFAGENGKQVERYDDSIFELSDFNRASFRLKSKLSLIEDGVTSMGFTKYVDSESTFQLLRNLLSNRPDMTFDEAMDYLKSVKIQPALLTKVANTISNWDTSTKNEFMTVLKLIKNKTAIVLWNKDGGYNAKIIEADRDSGGRMMVQEWESNFIYGDTNVENYFYQEFGELITSTPDQPIMINVDRINAIKAEYLKIVEDYFYEEGINPTDKPSSIWYANRIAPLLNQIMIDVTPEEITWMMEHPDDYAEIGEGYYRRTTSKYKNGSTALFDSKFGIIGVLFANIGYDGGNMESIDDHNYVSEELYNPFTNGSNYFANLGKYISTNRGNPGSESAIGSSGKMRFNYTIYDHLTSTVSRIRNRTYKNNSAFGKSASLTKDPLFDTIIMDSLKEENSTDYTETYQLKPVEIELEELAGIQNNGAGSRMVNGPTNSDKSRGVKVKLGQLETTDSYTADNIRMTSASLVKGVMAESERMTQYAALSLGNRDIKSPDGKTGNKQFDKGFRYFYTLPTANVSLAKDKLKQLITKLISKESIDNSIKFNEDINKVLENEYNRYLEYYDYDQDTYSNWFEDYQSNINSGYDDQLNNPDLAHFVMLASRDANANSTDWNMTLDEFVDRIIGSNYDLNESLDTAIPKNDYGLVSLLAANKYNEDLQTTLSYWKDNNIDITKMDKKWLAKLDRVRTTDAEILAIAAREANSYSQHVALEYYQLISGDPASFYKGPYNENKLIDQTAEETSSIIKKSLIEVIKRNAKNLASGTKPNFNILRFNENTKTWGYEQQKTYITATINDNEKASINKDIMAIPRLAKMYGSDKNGKGKMNIADALEYTSFEEHLHVMWAKGALEEKLYRSLLPKAYAQDRLKWNETIKPEDKLSEEELGFVFGMMKPVQVNNIEFKSGLANYSTRLDVYVKSSAMPLIHQVVGGLEIAKLKDGMFYQNDKLREQPINRLAHISAVKSGALRVAEVWKDGKINDNALNNISPVELSRDGFYIQQEIPYKESKEQILIMSQMDKLFTEGYAQHDKTNVLGRKDAVKKAMFLENQQEFIKRFDVETNGNSYSFRDTKNVVEILKKEGYSRGFTKNMIEYLNTDEKGQLVVPMFFNLAANKYESLMTSLISKIILQKTHGHSYVQSSSAGIRTLGELNQNTINDIVLIDGYKINGDLQFITKGKGADASKIYAAEVMVPFKFSHQGKILDIRQFTKKDANGNTIIDHDKLPKDLLNLIGGRIPGQGHNSMLPIRIVGFLPKYMGDTMIVPGEIVVQMGSDFDVDKLYAYMWNYSYSPKTGKINKYYGKNIRENRNKIYDSYKQRLLDVTGNIDELYQDNKDNIDFVKNTIEDVNSKIEEIRNNIESIDEDATDETVDSLVNALEEQYQLKEDLLQSIKDFKEDKNDIKGNNQEIFDLKQRLYNERQAELDAASDNSKKDIKDLQNEYYDLHWEVLTDVNMFERIAESLDMEDIANEFDIAQTNNKSEVLGLTSKWFNRSTFLENRAGKTGVAIMANSIVMNSMMQGLGIKLNQGGLELNIKVKGANLNLNSLGRDAKSEYNNELRRIHKNLQNIQSEAVDNAKYGRLGALNLNEETFNAVNAFLMLSDSSKKTITEAGNNAPVGAVANDHVVALINQEAIYELMELKAKKFNQFNDKFSKKKDNALKAQQLNKYYKLVNGEDVRVPSILEMVKKVEVPSIAELNRYRYINVNDLNKDQLIEYYKIQYNALLAFLTLDEIGGQIAGVQKAIDGSTKGIGKSFIESELKERMYNERILGSNYKSSLFEISLSGVQAFDQTEYGAAVRDGVAFGNEVFGKMFPYKKTLNTMVDYFNNEGRPLTEKDLRHIFNFYKAYIFANDKLYTSSVDEERERLINSDDNIFDRVKQYKTSGDTSGAYLTKGLVVQDKTKTKPQRIKFAAGKNQRVDEELNTVSLLRMLNNPDVEISKLGNDLITYAFLTNPIQSANNFMKYVPSSIMLNDQINNYLNDENIKLIDTDLDYQDFMRQFMMHNPNFTSTSSRRGDYQASIHVESYAELAAAKSALELAFKKIDKKDKAALTENGNKQKIISNKMNQFSTGENPIFTELDGEKELPRFRNVNFYTYEQDQKVDNGTFLFETHKNKKTGEYTMTMVPILGNNDEKRLNSSEIKIDKTNNANHNMSIANVVNTLGLTEPNKLGQVLDNVKRFADSYYAEAATILKNVVPLNYDIKVDNDMQSTGSHNSTKKLIRINPNFSNKKDSANNMDDIASTVIHESIHPLLDRLLDEYAKPINTLTDNQKSSIARLDVLRKEAIKHAAKNNPKEFKEFLERHKAILIKNGNKLNALTKLQEVINRFNLINPQSIVTSYEEGNITPEMKAKYYGLVNINEFVTMAWSDNNFQKIINGITASETEAKGFIQKVLDAFNSLIKALFESFGIDIDPNSILGNTLAESYNLMSDGKIPENNKGTTWVNKSTEKVIYSGAALGSDQSWSKVAREYRFKTVDYTTKTYDKLTPIQKEEVEKAYLEAVRFIMRSPLPADTYSGKLVRRDYIQAKAGDAVFAIVEGFENKSVKNKGNSVNNVNSSITIPLGETAYAVVMADKLGKQVNVFNQDNGKWYKYNNGKINEIEPPILTDRFTGIGTINLNAVGLNEISNTYERSYGSNTDSQVEPDNNTTDNTSESISVNQSVKDVFNTLEIKKC